MVGYLRLTVPSTGLLTPPSTNSAIFDFVGPFQTVAQTVALSSNFAAYEGVWTTNESPDFTQAAGFTQPYNEIYSGGAIYDRPKMYYVWADRLSTDNPSLAATYQTRGATLAVSHRDNYLAAGTPTEPFQQWYSMALHYMATGSATTLTQIGYAGDRAAYYQAAGWWADLNQPYANLRVVARALSALLSAQKTSAPSVGAPGGFPGGNVWANVLPLILNDIISTQAADGGWRFSSQSFGTKPYQVGLICGYLIDYYRFFNADSRIPGVIKKAQNFMWNNMLAANNYLFYSETLDINDNVVFDATYDTADVNNFQLSSLGLLYYLTGDTTYRTRGDALLAYWLANAFVSGYKQLSEGLHDSYRYPWYRTQTPVATMDQGVPICSVAPVVSGGAGTYTVTTGTWSNSPSSYAYQWKRYTDSVYTTDVGTGTNSYSPGAGAGLHIYCVVTATNGSGAGVPARSNLVNT